MPKQTSYQQEFTLTVAGRSLTVVMRASRRRSLKLGVTPKGEVDVRVPLQVPKREVLAFLREHEAWLLEQLQRVERVRAHAAHVFMWLGQPYEVVPAKGRGVRFDDDARCVHVPEHWSDDERVAGLEAFRRAQARVYFQQRIDHFFPRFERFASRVPILRVKNMRTRWGSLSSLGYINLSLALSQHAPALVDVVVIHELCHLKHMDHGAGFQALMDKNEPRWRELQAQLQASGREALSL